MRSQTKTAPVRLCSRTPPYKHGKAEGLLRHHSIRPFRLGYTHQPWCCFPWYGRVVKLCNNLFCRSVKTCKNQESEKYKPFPYIVPAPEPAKAKLKSSCAICSPVLTRVPCHKYVSLRSSSICATTSCRPEKWCSHIFTAGCSIKLRHNKHLGHVGLSYYRDPPTNQHSWAWECLNGLLRANLRIWSTAFHPAHLDLVPALDVSSKTSVLNHLSITFNNHQ